MAIHYHFLLAGFFSETARKEDWLQRKPLNLFENNYRMGSLVFGGGHVLMPMMYEQYSVRPLAKKMADSVAAKNQIEISKEDMTTGMGIVRAMPGPVFSIASFTGGMALKDMGFFYASSRMRNWFSSHFSSQCFICSFLFPCVELP